MSPRTASITRGNLACGNQARRAALLHKQTCENRIELGARAPIDLCKRLSHGQRRPVRPRRDHRIERVRDGKDSRIEWDLLTTPPAGIAAAIPVLVVEEHGRDDEAKIRLTGEAKIYGRRIASD